MQRMIGPEGTEPCRLWSGIVALALVLAFPLLGQSQASLPDGPGKDVFATVCTQCHGMNGIITLRLSRIEWEGLVDDMIARGAPAFDNDYEVIANYLATNFGVDSRIPAITSLAGAQTQTAPQQGVAEGPGKELVDSNCAGCHALSFVTSTPHTRVEWQDIVVDMIALGAPLLDDDVDVIVQYLADVYGPDGGNTMAAGTAGSRNQQDSEDGDAVGSTGLPEGPGRELVATVCTHCHGLNNVITLRLTAEEWEGLVNDMIARGAPAFDDQYMFISQYLSRNFGRGN